MLVNDCDESVAFLDLYSRFRKLWKQLWHGNGHDTARIKALHGML